MPHRATAWKEGATQHLRSRQLRHRTGVRSQRRCMASYAACTARPCSAWTPLAPSSSSARSARFAAPTQLSQYPAGTGRLCAVCLVRAPHAWRTDDVLGRHAAKSALHAMKSGRECRCNGCRAPQLEWFADSAFNAGRAAAADGDAMSAAVLFGAAGKFHAATAAPTARGLANQRVRCSVHAQPCLHMHA